MTRAGGQPPDATVAGEASQPPSMDTHPAVPEIADRFSAAWRSADVPPDLAAFLPDSPAIRRLALIELVKIDLENRWMRDEHPKRLADYMQELPELQDWPIPPDLIYEEFHARRRSGSEPDPAEYTSTFPGQSGTLAHLLSQESYHSTLMAHSGAPVSLDEISEGQRIHDFDLITELGRGAFAKVFLARQRSMQRLVAVKVSEAHGTEPQTLAQLDHDYIVRVFDQRLLEGSKLRLLYMEYVPAGTLYDVLERVRVTQPAQRSGQLLLDVLDGVLGNRGELRPGESTIRGELATMSWPETVAWLGKRLADAADYAARHGVLHRDIKPANVLLTAEGLPKLADFNISFSASVKGANPVAYFGGSLPYMSPEQLEVIHPDHPRAATDLDARSDLYSLCVMLWELLTGRKPFDDGGVAGGDRSTIDAMLIRRATVEEPSLQVLPQDCPTALRRVLLKGLSPDRESRWASGAELAQQFRICLDEHARDLVYPSPDSWRKRLRRWNHPIMAFAIAAPNALAILYSYNHNKSLIIDQLASSVQEQFDTITRLSYLIAFPLGVVFTISMQLYFLSVARGLRRGLSYSRAQLARARAHTLLLGQRVVLLCFALWVTTGIGIPVTLYVSGASVPASSYAHFISTQLVCGAIALAYPFFLVNFYAVRCLYPMFVPLGEISTDDARRLRRLDHRSDVFLAIAAAIPLIGVAGVTFIPPEDFASVIVAVRVLCVGSVIAFVLAYWLFRMLEKDVRALERVAAVR
ncbi:serine/threonine-protein kinase [Hoyosella altamirensis]|uniref:Serine/threonine protein kinase n=1 Tax=Hoyosella altamirensis TaxID=616997 RepID=A0A839RJ17_9ACTN|nr:serine/threonine-protein kinase [Hoyosella altamirensis]MBB3036822.1 serine/threonine protein kinase [Hoyosella altamirensis]